MEEIEATRRAALLGAAALYAATTSAAEAQSIAERAVPLWPNGAPGFESRRTEPEQARDWWVKNIHNPSITPFIPTPQSATRAAVIVVPGGGHREVVFPPEGLQPAQFLQSIGVAGFALKYRLAREEGSPYRIEHAADDVRRAVRLVRTRASEWNVDPTKIGIMGWSAGGELAAMVTYGATDGDADASDAIDRASCAPDFQIVIYPGGGGVPRRLRSTPPPGFFLTANDDPVGAAETIARLMALYREAGGEAEAHIFRSGGHGFNMGDRSTLRTINTWPMRMADWLYDLGLARRVV